MMNSVLKLLRKVYRGVGTPLALGAQMLLDSEGVAGVQKNLALRRPDAYRSASEYFDDAIVVELTRKLLLEGDKSQRIQRAQETFYACEAENYRTHARLKPYLDNLPQGATEVRVMDFIHSWRKVLKRVLGPLPTRLDPVFTDGSTQSDKGQCTTIPDKMSSQQTVYDGSLDIWEHTIAGTILERRTDRLIVDSNTFFTVPKDSFKDRGCCIEASSAIMMQRGLALHLLRRYTRHYGVVPKFAKELHMSLAQKASLNGDFATIDLSNASDTLSWALVKLVMPNNWYELLESLRAKHTIIEGKKVYLYKFSSMGNGYTFELETLIFRSLIEALGVSLYDSTVFGDDIIVPSSNAKDVIAALKFFGFTPNERKTFCEGPFRESCGGDYFDGTPVRAHYLKKLPDEPQHWVSLANGLRRLDPSLRRFGAAYYYCVDQVPIGWRNFGPQQLGDLVFWDPDARPVWRHYLEKDSVRWRYVDGLRVEIPDHERSSRIPMWRVKRPVQKELSLERGWAYDVQLACLAMGTGGVITPRDSIIGYKDDWVPAHGINHLNEWYFVNALNKH